MKRKPTTPGEILQEEYLRNGRPSLGVLQGADNLLLAESGFLHLKPPGLLATPGFLSFQLGWFSGGRSYDKSGKEIYEGDVVLNVEPGLDFDCEFEVIWTEDEWMLKETQGKDYDNLGRHNKDVEVIGNIYENQELVKE